VATGDWKGKLEKYKNDFEEAMDEDFNTAEALAVLFNLTREVNNLLNSDEEISEGVLSEVDSFYRTYGGDVLGIVRKKRFNTIPMMQMLIKWRKI
jgi:cysteinyl-tRNA synthetase